MLLTCGPAENVTAGVFGTSFVGAHSLTQCSATKERGDSRLSAPQPCAMPHSPCGLKTDLNDFSRTLLFTTVQVKAESHQTPY